METNTKLLRLQISRISLADADELAVVDNNADGENSSADKPALVVAEVDVPKEKSKPKKGNEKKIED
jgi:hypothetical protein